MTRFQSALHLGRGLRIAAGMLLLLTPAAFGNEELGVPCVPVGSSLDAVAAPAGNPAGEERAAARPRGQNQGTCPSGALPLHQNATAGVVNVSGDLVVLKNSCPVRITYGPGPNDFRDYAAETDLGITVPVQPGFTMTGRCLESRANACKWSFDRTSP
jgi:hypothetical protein